MNALIIDGDEIVIKLLEHVLLDEFDCKIMSASDESEIFEVLDSGFVPDVCLIDLETLSSREVEVIGEMRSYRCFDETPVLVISSERNCERSLVSSGVEFFAVVEKPIRPRKLVGLVRDALAGSGTCFDPTGFRPKEEVLSNGVLDAEQYYKLLFCFVEMLGLRMDIIEKCIHVSQDRVSELLWPLKKLCKQLGGHGFLDHFSKIEDACSIKGEMGNAQKRCEFGRLRSDFYALKDEMEARFNVFIDTKSSEWIMTDPELNDRPSGGVRLKASLESARAQYSLNGPSILVSATEGERELVVARLGVDRGKVVLKQIRGDLELKDEQSFV